MSLPCISTARFPPTPILHIRVTEPMHYALCSMHPISLHPMVVPMPDSCINRFMHQYIMYYENFNCRFTTLQPRSKIDHHLGHPMNHFWSCFCEAGPWPFFSWLWHKLMLILARLHFHTSSTRGGPCIAQAIFIRTGLSFLHPPFYSWCLMQTNLVDHAMAEVWFLNFILFDTIWPVGR
jgi:hypothetical protein